jgi:hypothetical protein
MLEDFDTVPKQGSKQAGSMRLSPPSALLVRGKGPGNRDKPAHYFSGIFGPYDFASTAE